MPNVPVTDPDILSQLNGGGPAGAPPPGGGGRVPVSDPEILKQLNGEAGPKQTPEEAASLAHYGKQGTLSDIDKSVTNAVPKGVAGLLGIFGDMQTLRDHAIDYLMRHAEALGTGKDVKDIPTMLPDSLAKDRLPTSADVRSGLEKISMAPLYEPQTGPGKLADRVVEGATMGGLKGPVAAATAVGGATGYAGRQIAGTPGDIAGSLLGAGLTSLWTSLKSAPEKILAKSLEGVTDEQLKQADALLEASHAKGTPLTGAEAIAQATGGNRRLTDLQRYLEGTPEGAAKIGPMINERPAANQTAMAQEARNISPTAGNPTEIAPKVQGAAEQTVNETRQAINDATSGLYERSAAATVPDEAMTVLKGDPVFQDALNKVRQDPVYGNLKDMPDNSIAVLDAVKKKMGRIADTMDTAGDTAGAAAYKEAKGAAEGAAKTASTDYALAVGGQSTMREQFLDPLKRSVTGQLAEANPELKTLHGILFSPAPVEGTETQVAQAMKTLVAKDPETAQQFVRAYLTKTFDEVAQDLVSGGNAYGGAKFAANVSGNQQQAKNLKAALEALPNGAEISESFGNLLQILKAQGKRAPAGSATENNQQIAKTLSTGSTVGEAVKTATSPQTWLGKAGEMGDRISYAANSKRLAEILTSPDSVGLMRKLAKMDPKSEKAQALVNMLIAGDQSANQ